MRGLNITDIILCIFLLPGMMFLFPFAEWVQWHPGKVLAFVVWLYIVYFLCRKVLGPLFLGRRRTLFTGIAAVFVIVAITFVMTLARVDFPTDPGVALQPHVRAMWIMLLAVLGMSLPLGVMEAQIKVMGAHILKEDAEADAATALRLRASDALGDGEILVKSGYSTVHVPLAAIQYVESRNNYCCFHIDNQEDVVSQMTLKNALEMLPEGKFIRIHRSYVVPVWRIETRSMTQVKLMGLEDTMPVGRAYKDGLKNG